VIAAVQPGLSGVIQAGSTSAPARAVLENLGAPAASSPWSSRPATTRVRLFGVPNLVAAMACEVRLKGSGPVGDLGTAVLSRLRATGGQGT
jgi:hypothetical protein